MSHHAENLIRRLGRRYGSVLGVVAALLVIDQAALQPMLIRLNSSAPTINLAGRQRMLSQSIVKAALQAVFDPTTAGANAEALTRQVALWRQVHAALIHGDRELGIEGTKDEAIREAVQRMMHDVDSVSTAVMAIVGQPESIAARLPALIAAEQSYLSQMEQVVRLFEQDAQRQIRQLRTVGLSATGFVIVLIAALHWLVLRPAVNLIRRQVGDLEDRQRLLCDARDQLEARVRQRTMELVEANRQLELAAVRREAAERRTLALQGQLAHAARVHSLGELATGIAHEVNQPLGAIANDAETLLLLVAKEQIDSQGVSRTATRLRNAAARAGVIIRRMRNFVRSREVVRSVEAVNTLIDDALSLCESDFRRLRVRPELDLVDTADMTLLVDGIQFQQVVVNLVRNSLQAIEAASDRSGWLRISTACIGSQVHLTIEDNGPGFSEVEDDLRPFASTKADGLGLGLTISRSIVAAHGGEMELQNRAAGGACVTIRLPALQPLEHLEPADHLCCR